MRPVDCDRLESFTPEACTRPCMAIGIVMLNTSVAFYATATVRDKKPVPELAALGIEVLSLDVASPENIA